MIPQALANILDDSRLRIRLLLDYWEADNPINGPDLDPEFDRLSWCEGGEPCYAADADGTVRRWTNAPFSVSGLGSSSGQSAATPQAIMGLSAAGNSNRSEPNDGNEGSFQAEMSLHIFEFKRVDLLVAVFDPDTSEMNALGSIVLARCAVDQPAIVAGAVTLRLGPARDPANIPYPRRKKHPACQFTYGGPGCGPKGPLARCNKTPSTTGGCGDPNSAVGSPSYGKLGLGVNGGFYFSRGTL